jgi:hypothetical protein
LTDINETSKSIEILRKQLETLAKEDISKVIQTNTEIEKSTESLGESINALKEKLKQLQEQRDASTDDKQRASLNIQIKQTEDRIAVLEGRSSKAVTKSENDLAKLMKELQKIRDEQSLFQLSALEKELREIDIKFEALRVRARNNHKLLMIIEELFLEARLQAIQKNAEKEIEIISRVEAGKAKTSEEKFKKNLEQIKGFAIRFEEETIKQLDRIDRSRLASRELAVLKSRGKEKLKAELELLEEQRKQEIASKDLTQAELLLVEEKYRIKRRDAELSYWSNLIDTIAGFASQALEIDRIFSDAKMQRENSELERDRKLNDKKKQNLERRLKSNAITQLQYDREIQKIEKDQERREREIRMKQFKREQRGAVIQALINGAQGVTKAIATYPWPLNLIPIAFAVASTAAQIVSINSRKPPEYGRGALLVGPSHSDKSKGMPVSDPYTGKVKAYVEGGEGLINKRSMADPKQYEVKGTISQIASFLNAKHGGVNWTTGAKLVPGWKNSTPKYINFPAIRKYAEGGILFGGSSSAGSGVNSSNVVLMNLVETIQDLRSSNDSMRQTVSDLQTTLATMQKKGIKAKVLLTEQEEQQERLDAIREDATQKNF